MKQSEMDLWPGATVTRGQSKGKQGSSFPMLRCSIAVSPLIRTEHSIQRQVAKVCKKPSFQDNVVSKPSGTGQIFKCESNQQKMLQMLAFRTGGGTVITETAGIE